MFNIIRPLRVFQPIVRSVPNFRWYPVSGFAITQHSAANVVPNMYRNWSWR